MDLCPPPRRTLAAVGDPAGVTRRATATSSRANVLWPSRLPPQRHQERLDIPAGPESEPRAAVVEQVELDIATAAAELVAPLLRVPGQTHTRPHDRRIGGEKCLADHADKSEIALGVAAIEIVEENPAGAAHLVAMRQKEIFVAPFLVLCVGVWLVSVAGGGERGMKRGSRRLIGIDRRQVGAAAKPRLAGHDMARVHVRSGHQWRARMRDERDAARPEARVFRSAGDFRTEFGGEFAEHGRDVDPDLLKDTAFHQRDRAAAARLIAVGALPVAAREPRRRGAGEIILDRFEFGANAIAQRGEPLGGALTQAQILFPPVDPPAGSWPVLRSAS